MSKRKLSIIHEAVIGLNLPKIPSTKLSVLSTSMYFYSLQEPLSIQLFASAYLNGGSRQHALDDQTLLIQLCYEIVKASVSKSKLVFPFCLVSGVIRLFGFYRPRRE